MYDSDERSLVDDWGALERVRYLRKLKGPSVVRGAGAGLEEVGEGAGA